MGKPPRLYFIDALRAFAILMMLQGHFISGLLDPVFKDPSNPIYSFWLYCRGFTAPVFFTITVGCLPFYCCAIRSRAGKIAGEERIKTHPRTALLGLFVAFKPPHALQRKDQ